ncbi:MAG TPA: hypothetical protein VE984_09450 [Gaiellaceae bacterium]|nr:hypothetical protein [Gaiellaceae bacterium]
MATRLTRLLVLAGLALAFTASAGSAAGRARTPLLGVVPHMTPAAHARSALAKAVATAAPAALTVDAGYQTLIDRYFADVAHDSGGVQNVYSVATQYTDGSGAVAYSSTFGGAYVDHDPLPTSECSDGVDAYCVTDQQLQDEILTAMTANGWQGGLEHVFFLMTPNGVGSCEFAGSASSSNPCSSNAFCAYHSAFGTLADPVVYADEPYEGPLPRGECTGPDQGFPNGDVDAETTINTISHEHNEAITDPLGNAWVEPNGTENGDLCAYGFGTQTGTGAGAYNQVIDGHRYDLQQEYSNVDGGCVQRLHGTPTPPTSGAGPLPDAGQGPVMHRNTTYAIYWLPLAGVTAPPAVTGTASVGQTLKSSAGTWNGAPTGFHYQWQRCSPAGTGCVDITGATASSYRLRSADGGHRVRSTVSATNVNGVSAPAASAATAKVIDAPAARKLPHISGRMRVGKKVSATHGSWSYSPTRFRYQWLRCDTHGGHCTTIRHATHATYRLTTRDERHRLRVRVTATNAVGSRKASSQATARVPAQ